MTIRKATPEQVREILAITDWTMRELAAYWDCTEAAIYQWLAKGEVSRGFPTFCVLTTLEQAKRGELTNDEEEKPAPKKPREKATA